MAGPLLRPRYDRKVAGVCAAFARAYGWDLNVVRIAVLVLALTTGVGLIGYVICWVVIPEDPAGTAYPATTAYGAPPAQSPPQQYPPYTGAPPPSYPPPPDQPPAA